VNPTRPAPLAEASGRRIESPSGDTAARPQFLGGHTEFAGVVWANLAPSENKISGATSARTWVEKGIFGTKLKQN